MRKGVISAISTMAGAIAGAGITGRINKKKFDKINDLSEKHLALFLLMNQWVNVKQDGKNLAEYLEKSGYKKIAIYGMSYVGETLLEELKETSIEVVYGIDQRGDTIYTDIDIMTMDDDLDHVDAVIVTAITYFEEIKEQLSDKIECPVISIDDILHEV